MKRLLMAAVLLLASCGTARADPITALITGAAAWYASIGVVGQLLVQVGIGILLSAASYGIQYLLSQGGKQQEQAAQTQTQGTQVPEYDGLLEVRRAYGTAVNAGGVFFSKTVIVSPSTTPNRWVFGLALSEGICDALVSVIINGVECEVDAAGVPQMAPWNNGTTTYFSASFRSGTDTQAIDSVIATRFSSPPDDFYPDATDRTTRWTEFRQRGVATLVLDMEWGTDADHHIELWGVGGIPQLQAKFRGLRVYDRTDPSQDPDDATTWDWSETATVIIEDLLVAEIGGQVLRDDMADTATKESIVIDAGYVPTLDGVERRGRINGVVYAGESPIDVLGAMLQQNRGILSKTSGEYVIRSDRTAEAVATIWKGQWRGALSFQNEVDTRAAIDGIVAQFYPAVRFNQAAETAYPNSALDDPNATRVTFKFSDSPSEAQRLAYAMLTKNTEGRTISGVFDISVLAAAGKANRQLEIGDCVTFDAPSPYDDMNGLYQVDGLSINADFTVALSLSGTSANVIDGWSPSLETAFAEAA
jgi:hypothetical protein